MIQGFHSNSSRAGKSAATPATIVRIELIGAIGPGSKPVKWESKVPKIPNNIRPRKAFDRVLREPIKNLWWEIDYNKRQRGEMAEWTKAPAC